jgi:hypothetical protein
MKGRRRILLILAACAVVALVAAVFWPKEREPVYQGKKLSEWLAMYCVSTDSQVPDKEAEEAILGIGTNALPVLVKWIAREPPDWKKGLVDELEHLNKRRLWQRIWYPALSDMELQREATYGFRALGGKAKGAAKNLLGNISRQRQWSWSAFHSIEALGFLGNDGVTALVSIATNRSFGAGLRVHAMDRLARMSPADSTEEWVVPILVGCLNDPATGSLAAKALGSFGLRADLCVPALVSCSGSTKAPLRLEAVRALGRFGGQAREAVPALVNALNDSGFINGPPAEFVAWEATNALRKIAPEVLENRGVK